MCGDCYETIGEENINHLSLLDKVEEQDLVIQQTIQANEEMTKGWELQQDSNTRKVNS